MNTNPPSGSQTGRFHWGSYGFLAGILIGLFMGWFFHGFVGAFVRFAMFALIIVPIVLAFIAWRKVIAPWLNPPARQDYSNGYNGYASDYGAIETRAVVRGVVNEPPRR